MLSAMGERSFVVAYAYIKTEPVQVALFSLIFLGDKVTPLSAAAILIATVGVIVISLKPHTGAGTMRSTLIGLAGGTMFALSAISYRGAILSLGLPDFVLAATFTVTVGLVIQAALLSTFLDCAIQRSCGPSHGPGNPRCLPALWVHSRRNSGSSPSPSPPPPMCARSHW
jgi:drug/metabolite transporter (DMT)-like permease